MTERAQSHQDVARAELNALRKLKERLLFDGHDRLTPKAECEWMRALGHLELAIASLQLASYSISLGE